MIKSELKIYKDLIEVEITDFVDKKEVLYWEWTMKDFSYKYKTMKSIWFPIHWWRVIDCNRIQWFDVARSSDFTLEHKISSLEKIQQEAVKDIVKKYKRDFKKNPTNARVDNVIDRIINPNKQKIQDLESIKNSLIIINIKKARIEFYESLDSESKNKVQDYSWQLLFKDNPWFLNDKNNIKAKSLFFKYRNLVIDKMLIKKEDEKHNNNIPKG